ncbi:MAG: helix-turn-helix domain-containing protein [Lawsonibacter sp.]|nr:helix-turn-helix domain-containing protein [Lawsonibacter sp.]
MGISVAELARRSGVPPAILEKLEQGVLPAEMMAHHTWMLAEAFGCEIYELFE